MGADTECWGALLSPALTPGARTRALSPVIPHSPAVRAVCCMHLPPSCHSAFGWALVNAVGQLHRSGTLLAFHIENRGTARTQGRAPWSASSFAAVGVNRRRQNADRTECGPKK